MKSTSNINWKNTLFLIITPIVAVIGSACLFSTGAYSSKSLWLALILAICGGLSITAGYHRLFSHSSYKTYWPIRLFYILFGAACFEGSVLEWSTDHRDHHRYTDTPKDPYNFQQGFWYAHIGWLFTLDTSKRNYANVQDLAEDPLVRFQHRFFGSLAILMGFVLPMLLGLAWGDMWGGLIFAGAVRITLTQHMTFCINSVCHYFGKQTYSDRNSARDNWVTALFTFGEGFHNFHHKFPLDYRNGIRIYHYDPTKWLIRALSFCRLASDLKTVNEHRIIQHKLDMDKLTLTQTTSKVSSFSENRKEALHALHHSISQLLIQRDKLETAYQNLKQSKIEYVQGRMAEYKKLSREYHLELSKVSFKLKHELRNWTRLVKHFVLPSAINH